MLNSIIRFSLQQRFLVVALSMFLLAYGGWQISQLPIDVFPDRLPFPAIWLQSAMQLSLCSV